MTAGELDEFVRVLQAAAGYHVSDDQLERARASYELDRTLAVFDGGRIVAGSGSDVLELTLPGPTTVRVARVTETGVLPTHRRRGLLTALMARQLQDIQQRGEHLAILTASEGGIYRRFGYGPATHAMSVEIDRAHTAFARPAEPVGQLRLLDDDEAALMLPALFDEHRRVQPGQVMRTKAFWLAWLRDPERRRMGAGRRFVVAYEAATTLSGYATYRFSEGGSTGARTRALVVEDLVATSAQARMGLWSHCLNTDMIEIIRAPNVPVDEPLAWMLADPRRLRVTSLVDFLWIRLIDLPWALSAREYAASGRLVLDVTDDAYPLNSGRFELEAGPGGTDCRRTRKPPDLALGASELGAAYLGGVSFGVLARAGRVEECTSGGLDRADALFVSRPAPWCVTDW